MKTIATLSLLLATTLAACATDDGTPDITAPVTETAATLHADGTVTTTSRQVSVEEQLAELGQRDPSGDTVAAQLVSQDTACVGSSMWVYDQPNRTGSRVCF